MNRAITIWNKKELYLTRDLNMMNSVHDILSKHGINYITRTNSITNLGRHHSVPNIQADHGAVGKYSSKLYPKSNHNWIQELEGQKFFFPK